MEVLMTILYALVIVVALLLAILILIQPSKSGGFGTVFGGVGESVFGARAGSHLTKATVVLTVIFFLLALTLASLIGHSRSGKSLVDEVADEPAVQKAVPVAAADAKAAAPAKAPEKAAEKKTVK
ncbi:MAG: preprotein translocase subunit SecG [Lentisphaerae bacterium]|nr:preprotein translocase subunit SecG [Lentisphaerota bacterium]